MASSSSDNMKISSPPSSESTSSSSSSSSSSNSPSPGLDDPLSYLLRADNSTDEASSQAHSPPDWSAFTSWLENASLPPQDKIPDMSLGSEFGFSTSMDIDFDPSMAIDPSSLHFNTSIFTQPEAIPVLDHTSTFKPDWFTQLLDQNDQQPNRRFSVTPSSSSGASFSPIVEQCPASAPSATSDTNGNADAVAELAQRVLQAAGVTFAVPVDTKPQVNASQPKLPIPRLPRPVHTVSILNKSPHLNHSTEVGPSSVLSAPTTNVIGRPKTNHTTIERRYRTNLNARITGLKQSVPALRVLEARLSGKDSTPTDVVDDRGFVDGVKVGRKMSKANVLGKATEYIKVLKRRENRLKREQDGLKSLIGGLVNGSALLQAWETQWRESFGGPEKDEIEEETGSDEEEGDGEGDEDDEDSGRAKKRARTIKPIKDKPVKQPTVLPATPRTTTTIPSVLPEKRKRGRPRKVPGPSPTPAITPPLSPSVLVDSTISTSSGQSSSQQYLLAAFVFISFFNSPLTSSSPYAQPHHHTGSVLNHVVPAEFVIGYGWRDIIQVFHLIVSTVVFFSILVPWLPKRFSQTKLASRLSPINLLFPESNPHTPASSSNAGSDSDSSESIVISSPRSASQRNPTINHQALLEALSLSFPESEAEGRALRNALGISSGVIGLCQGIVKVGKKDRGIELNQLEQRAWVRLGEIVALDDNVSVATRLQTYWGMSWHISTFSASTTDLTTLALIIRPISGSRASSLWGRAGKREILRPYEKLVLETMDVHEAARRLNKWKIFRSGTQSFGGASPLRVLAELMIRERIKKHASVLFVKSVDKRLHRGENGSDSDSDDENYFLDAEIEAEDEAQRTQTVLAGRSLGGSIADLALSLEKVWEMRTSDFDESPLVFDEDTKALLSAVVLYRKIFNTSLISPFECANGEIQCSVILTPPPSPTKQDGELHLALRKVLGSSVFEPPESNEDEGRLALALEDAKDYVVDMLVDVRRLERVVQF